MQTMLSILATSFTGLLLPIEVHHSDNAQHLGYCLIEVHHSEPGMRPTSMGTRLLPRDKL